MAKHDPVIVSKHDASKEGTLASYSYGFIFSVFLTTWAYMLVVYRHFTRPQIIAGIIAFAFVQFIIQMVLFLHLGSETKPRLRLWGFLFMLMVVVILAFGSIWIMNDLSYRMTPLQMEKYLKAQDGL